MPPSTSSGQATQGVVTSKGKPIIGWQEIDSDGNPVGEVMTIDYTIKNKFNIKDPNLRTSKIVTLPK